MLFCGQVSMATELNCLCSSVAKCVPEENLDFQGSKLVLSAPVNVILCLSHI